jgi:hypothetical protein
MLFDAAFTAMTALGTIVAAKGKALAAQSQSRTDAVAGNNSYTEADIADLQGQLYGVNTGIDQSNESIARTQAQIAEGGVDLAYARERVAEARIAETGRQVIAAQRERFSSGNLDDRTGSPLLVQALTAGRVKSDIDLTRANGAIEAAAAKTTAANLQSQVTSAMEKNLSDTFGQAGSLLRAKSLRAQGASLLQ